MTDEKEPLLLTDEKEPLLLTAVWQKAGFRAS